MVRLVHGPGKHAKGESFSKEKERRGRYVVGVSLVSLKTIGRYDVDRRNEFYFKVDGGKTFKNRVPNRGNIELRENQTFVVKSDDITLWSEFARFKDGDEKIIRVSIELREDDPLKAGKIEKIGSIDLAIKCPSKTDYIMLDSDDGETKAKLKVYAKETRF